MNKEGDQTLRTHLQKLLDWEDAHVNFDSAIADIPHNLQGVIPEGLPYSAWQLLEHLRRTQFDILDFCRNPDYVEPPFEDYWPSSVAPSTSSEWDESIARYRQDRESLKELTGDPQLDLFQQIPHGSGQTYLRELLLVADHNAYHVGQLVAVRRCLGIWK